MWLARGASALLLAAVLGLVCMQQAVSGPGADVTPEDGHFVVEGNERQSDTQSPGPRSEAIDAPERLIYVPVCVIGGSSVCESAKFCNGTGVEHDVYAVQQDGTREPRGTECLGGDSQSSHAPPREVTNALVLRALRRVEVPVPVLVVQPPGGKTLVNLETIFSTVAEPFSVSVELVGRRVDLRIEPVGYLWTHGDGTSQRSAGPGFPYAEGVAMSEYLTHVYTDAGLTVRPSVAVEYGASFRVDGGPWRAVVGTVTVQGDSVGLRVVEATPALVTPHR
jgi:hypothetical protein